MVTGKMLAIILVLMIFLNAFSPCFANDNDENISGIDTFLSLLRVWGNFLAVITGSYDSLQNIAIFSDLAIKWKSFITSDMVSKENFISGILLWMGILAAPKRTNQFPAGTYSL